MVIKKPQLRGLCCFGVYLHNNDIFIIKHHKAEVKFSCLKIRCHLRYYVASTQSYSWANNLKYPHQPRGIKMAESHVISALVLKRSEICGEIVAYREKIEALHGALKSLDASIKLFSPEFDLRTVKPKRTHNRNELFKHGEIQRLTFDVMRESTIPLSSREIVNKIIELKGIEETTETVAKIQRHIITMFRHKENTLVKQVDRGSDGAMKWVIFS